MIRKEVLELKLLGPLPDQHADEEAFERHEKVLSAITPPVSAEEAKILVRLFGPDDAYGAAWTLLHLIESAPSWPIEECLRGAGLWIDTLRRRAADLKR
ncbi:MAG: hypothetical protein WBX15_02490 [Thermoanaerobaculia bacterium]